MDFTADQVTAKRSHSIAGRSVTTPIAMESCPVVYFKKSRSGWLASCFVRPRADGHPCLKSLACYEVDRFDRSEKTHPRISPKTGHTHNA